MIRKYGKDISITLATCAFRIPAGEEKRFPYHFEAAQKAGFDGFELSSSSHRKPEVLLAAAKASQVKIVAVHGVLDGRSCSAEEAVRNQAAEDAFRYLATFAEFAPCPIVEHYWDRFNDPEKGKCFRDTVGKLLEKTERSGFVFCMENAPYKPEVNERYPEIAEIARFARSFGSGRMFMTFDVNHANLHEDVLYAVSACEGLIRHIHVSDNHGHREEHLVPGEGIIDLNAVIRKIYETDYCGPCNFEFGYPKGYVPELKDYQHAFEVIKTGVLA